MDVKNTKSYRCAKREGKIAEGGGREIFKQLDTPGEAPARRRARVGGSVPGVLHHFDGQPLQHAGRANPWLVFAVAWPEADGPLLGPRLASLCHRTLNLDDGHEDG